jgi:quercetin dioxygenase-like cupin family protein
MKGRITLALWVILAIAIAATQGRSDSVGSELATPSPASGLSRTVLGGATPAAAPDQSLELASIIIEPGTKLPLHEHPGTQIASIESGDLTYVVVAGTAKIVHASSEIEELHAGQQTVLHPGDTVIETEGMQHYGENRGDQPVVIVAASLFEAGMPPSVSVGTPTT